MTRRLPRPGFIALLAAALIAPPAMPALAADADAADQPKVETVKGKKQKFARTDVGRWLRVTDPAGDVTTAAGQVIPDAEGYGDIKRVSLLKGKTTNKLTKVWPKDYPLLAADAYRGENSQLRKKQNVVFLIIEMFGNPPQEGDPSVQVLVGADGSLAQPVVPSVNVVPTSGLEQLSASGVFKGGVFGSGTTYLGDTEPGEPVDLYGGESRDRGYLDRKKQAWYHIAYVPRNAEHITVAVQSEQDGVQAYDHLVLPTGERFLELDDRFFGYPREASELVCREVRTVQGPSDAGADGSAPFMLQTTMGFSDDFDLGLLDGRTVEFELAPADAAFAAVESDENGSATVTGSAAFMLRTTAGSSDDFDLAPADVASAAAEADENASVTVTGSIEVNPLMNSASVRVPIPADSDRWRGSGRVIIDEDDGLDPALAARLIDLPAATGNGGWLVATDRLGHLGGFFGCGGFVHDGAVCDLFDTSTAADMAGLGADGFELTEISSPTGLHICGGVESSSGQPAFIAGFEDAFVDPATFQARVDGHACPATPFGDGGSTFILDCGPEGFESLITLVTPELFGSQVVEGGFVASVDIRTETHDGSDIQLPWESYLLGSSDAWTEPWGGIRRWNDEPRVSPDSSEPDPDAVPDEDAGDSSEDAAAGS